MGLGARAGLAGLAALTVLALPAAPAAGAASPKVRELVVFKSGASIERTVRTPATSVKVGRKRCGVPMGSPLAALVRARPGRLGFKDYAGCRRNRRESGQLYVRSIRNDRARGQDGWVYKVGHRLANGGAADRGGPFGRGLLRSGQRIWWFYGRSDGGTFQRTLEADPVLGSGGFAGGRVVNVTVRGYDDEGRARLIAGATVTAGPLKATTGPRGQASFVLGEGTHRIVARKRGLVRSFTERVVVR